MVVLRVATLATGAMQHQNGTFSLLEAGLRTWRQAELPFLVPICLVVELEFPGEDGLGAHTFEVTTKYAADGEVCTRFSGDIVVTRDGIDPDLDPVCTIVAPIGFQARRAGLYLTTVDVDGEQLSELSLLAKTDVPSP